MNKQTIKREYDKRDLLSRYWLTQLDPIMDIIEGFQGKKMFKVDGGKTKAFTDALAPINTRPTKRLETDNIIMHIHSIGIQAGYSGLEVKIQATTKYTDRDQSNGYFDIQMRLGQFKPLSIGQYDKNDLDLRDREDLRHTLEAYPQGNRGDNTLQNMLNKHDKLEELNRQIEVLKGTMPYYTY